jgi:hypothetical protein
MALAEPDPVPEPTNFGRDPEPGETLTFVARPRSITAAARRIDPGSKEDLAWVPKKGEKWQDEAWAYVDAVPELKFASGFNGNALSRSAYVPGGHRRPGPAPVPIQDAVGEESWCRRNWRRRARRDVTDGAADGGIPGLLHEFGDDPDVPGDSWAVATPETPTEDEQWNVYSESAITKTDKGLALREARTRAGTELPDGTLFIRIWRRHSRWPGLADSNMRAVLSECEELLIYSRQFRAVGSPGTTRDLLFLSNKLDMAPPIDPSTASRGR